MPAPRFQAAFSSRSCSAAGPSSSPTRTQGASGSLKSGSGNPLASAAAPFAWRKFTRRLLVLGLIVSLLPVARVASLRGLLLPLRIHGPSMAPAWVGEHFAVICGDCRFPWRCGAGRPRVGEWVVCPNCGFAKNRLGTEQWRPGQRVLLDRGQSGWRPRRGDVVAVVSAEAPERLETKRVVGLPGEWVELRDGDVWSNGRPAQKSPRQLSAVVVPVHDDRYRPTRSEKGDEQLAHRWRAADNTGRWQVTTGGYRARRSGPPGERIERSTAGPSRDAAHGGWRWLEYHHRWSMPDAWSPPARGRNEPVLDYYPFNQDLPRGRMFVVSDLRLRCLVRLPSSQDAPARGHRPSGSGVREEGTLGFELRTESRRLRVEWKVDEHVLRLFDGERPLAAHRTAVAPRERWFAVELALCDGRVWFRTEDRPRLVRRLAPSRSAATETSSTPPLRVGVRGGLNVELRALRIDRDLYYFHPRTLEEPWSPGRRLGASEYLLLGDNVPVSRDSRHWQPPTVPRGRILGKVLRIPPGRSSKFPPF